MVSKKPESAPPVSEVPQWSEYSHSHPLAEHKHPHEHVLPEQLAELSERIDRIHLGLQDQLFLLQQALNQHQHDTAPSHTHRDLRGHLQGAVRALLTVLEVGNLNSEQVKAIHAVRVIIGDAHGSGCLHENTAYEENDILVCQDCRATI